MRFVPNWLQGMVAPTLGLWLCVITFAVMSMLTPEGMSPRSDFASRFTFPFIVAWWVVADARKRGRKLCYDFDSFVFFAAPVVVPVYLFQTRGVRAFLTLLCFGGVLLTGTILGAVILALREFLS
jgi:hypothetical protein